MSTPEDDDAYEAADGTSDHDPVEDPSQLGLGSEAILGDGTPQKLRSEPIDLTRPAADEADGD